MAGNGAMQEDAAAKNWRNAKKAIRPGRGGAKLTEPGRPARAGAGAAGTGRAVEGVSRAGTEIERQIRACPASFCRN